jgi:two-component sensor histidine kinase
MRRASGGARSRIGASGSTSGRPRPWCRRRKALPLAIIVHELVSNAVRHAFPDGAQRGSIAIAYSLASGGVSLVVRDSGVGAESLTPGDGLAWSRGWSSIWAG